MNERIPPSGIRNLEEESEALRSPKSGIFKIRDPETEMASEDGLNQKQRDALKRALEEMLKDPEFDKK